ncbi:hypothetical protein AM587_10011328 [Phytophthora nicotianae]|uniref:Uncharacterized protein n=1 Tax=Phytophthora nicotianae TaxID=4792 RepID=A0A0W8DA89_PHYNI|nr:hypothetical protein AM587_10011328 [Phytophthora nicotianae]
MKSSETKPAGPVLPERRLTKVQSITRLTAALRSRTSARRMLMIVWFSFGILPLVLQGRNYWKLVTAHKLTEDLVVSADESIETANITEYCPLQWLYIASAWWNVVVTHYYSVKHGQICHFVIPQYNVHGAFILGTQRIQKSPTTPTSCENESYAFEHYFYHGSIGYFAFYEEAIGTFCTMDKTAYVRVRGLGTFDSNASALARDRGDYSYRQSYWYGIFGLMWILYRILLLRKSYILCNRYGMRCFRLQETLSRKAAAVFMQESMRLSTHNSSNFFRVVVLYMLIEGVMSDLFLLIAQDGANAKLQYISLGYNLSGVLLLLFEMLESKNWLCEKVRLLVKRLLFSYETSLFGELLCAGVMNYFLTWVNRSSLKESHPAALAASYYVWSLVGHGVLVLGLAAFITSVRIVLSCGYILWHHRTWVVLTAPCCVDTTLGVRCKMITLAGYSWHNDQLYYKTEALKAFGVLKMLEEDGSEYFVFRQVHPVKVPRDEFLVIGSVSGCRVEPCVERKCTGPVSLFDRNLGGSHKMLDIINKVPVGPTQGNIPTDSVSRTS